MKFATWFLHKNFPQNCLMAVMLVCFVTTACKGREKRHLQYDEEPNKQENTITIIGSPEKDTITYEKEVIAGGDSIEIPVIPMHLPSQLLRRKAYVTSYNRETRCPNWVAWRLTEEHTDGPYNRKGVPYYDDNGIAIGIGRVTEETQKGDYFADMECEEPRQSLFDWSTEYNMSHGHLCPAGDNRWDKAAMNQSFLLTNMCPQDRKLNGGGWQKLEDKCRSWARRYGEVWIVAGPIFREGVHRRLGDIMIPEAFFKVVLCMKGEPRAIGFVYENTSESQSMAEQACTVDDIERITDYDFFSALPDSIEQRVEAMGDFGGAM